SGYGAFAPVMDRFLKEHLFADIFERDVLTYQQRELVTISALSSMGGVEPMLGGHMGIALNIGIDEMALQQIFSHIEHSIGKKEADKGRAILAEVVASKRK
ncbi:MAG TPA: carboxymuconolactone decarboxylase family protein, partial [Fodinibius sp.]|nr:carboxymuconolactone decarboxylase family protein [Fodinibius sp.]